MNNFTPVIGFHCSANWRGNHRRSDLQCRGHHDGDYKGECRIDEVVALCECTGTVDEQLGFCRGKFPFEWRVMNQPG